MRRIHAAIVGLLVASGVVAALISHTTNLPFGVTNQSASTTISNAGHSSPFYSATDVQGKSSAEQSPSATPVSSHVSTTAGGLTTSFVWESARCPSETNEQSAFLISPVVPVANEPLRVIVAESTDDNNPFEMAFRRAGKVIAKSSFDKIEVLDSSTSGYSAQMQMPASVVVWMLRQGEKVIACRTFEPKKEIERGAGPQQWGVQAEKLYSLWVSKLLSIERWQSFDGVFRLTRDPDQNILYNRLGLNEDAEKIGLVMRPDCADFPLTLRAYFAWKAELPFGVFRRFTPEERQQNVSNAQILASPTVSGVRRRISNEKAPPTGSAASKQAEIEKHAIEKQIASWNPNKTYDAIIDPDEGHIPAWGFREKLYKLSKAVSSLSLRHETITEDTNLYPIALERNALRPGAPFVDPYSHVSVIAGWERTDKGSTRLMLADAQPSGMITIHRYVAGSIVFRPGVASAGFKWFRNSKIHPEMGLIPWSNTGVFVHGEPALRPSFQEMNRTEESFQELLETMEDPRPRDPLLAYQELYDGLIDGLRDRARFVDEGWRFRNKRNKPIDMPKKEENLFSSEGDWESYSTPCRDLRLLTRLRQFLDFPSRVQNNPTRYVSAESLDSAAVQQRLTELKNKLADQEAVSYERTDGSKITLTLGQIIARVEGFEMAYNPNDCPEVRWAAETTSHEGQTCTMRAPAEQQELMNKFRSWFRQRYVCS